MTLKRSVTFWLTALALVMFLVQAGHAEIMTGEQWQKLKKQEKLEGKQVGKCKEIYKKLDKYHQAIKKGDIANALATLESLHDCLGPVYVKPKHKSEKLAEAAQKLDKEIETLIPLYKSEIEKQKSGVQFNVIAWTYTMEIIDVARLEEPMKNKVPVEIEFSIPAQASDAFNAERFQKSLYKRLDAFKQTLDDLAREYNDKAGKAGGNSDELSRLEEELNARYGEIVIQIQQTGVQTINEKWDSIKEKSAKLAEFTIKAKINIARGAFSIVKSAVTAVASGGMDISAYLTAASDVISIYQNVQSLLKGEDEARKELAGAAARLQEALKTQKSILFSLTKGPIKDVKEKMDLYEVKRTARKEQMAEWAKGLETLLNIQEKLPKAQQDDPNVSEIASAVQTILAQFDDVNKKLAEGGELIKQCNAMLDKAKQEKKLEINALDTINAIVTISGAITDPIGFLTDTGIEKAVDKVSEAYGKARAKYK